MIPSDLISSDVTSVALDLRGFEIGSAVGVKNLSLGCLKLGRVLSELASSLLDVPWFEPNAAALKSLIKMQHNTATDRNFIFSKYTYK